MALDNQSMWLRFLQELATKVAGSSATLGVQTLFPFAIWDWGGKSFPTDSIPYAQQIFLDRVPTEPVGNYLPAPAAFSSNYLEFLSQLNLQDGSDPKLEELYKVFDQALKNYDKTLKDAQIAWLNDKTKPQDQSFDTWLTLHKVWQTKINQAETDMTAAQTNYNDYRSQKFKDIQHAMSQYDTNLLFITNQAGQPVEVAPWFTERSPIDYVNTITGNHFGGPAVNGNQFAFQINESTSQYDYKKVWGTGDTGLKLGWLSIYAGGSFEKIDLSTFDSNWSINVAFESFDAVIVAVPDWYSSGVVQARRNGPYRTGFTGYKDSTHPNDVWFFGEQGLLGRMLTEMVVGYRPTITIEAGSKVHKLVKEKITGGGSLQIGPFRFSASGGSETESKFDFSQGSKITVTNFSNWPYIICNVAVPTVPSKAANQLIQSIRSAAKTSRRRVA